jgi:lipid A ethanolaminephosphotransferase
LLQWRLDARQLQSMKPFLTSLQQPPELGRWRIQLTLPQLLIAVSVLWLLTANALFFTAALSGRALNALPTWGFALALGCMLLSAHYLLISLLVYRWNAKPVLAVLIVASAAAAYFMQTFGIYLDPSMLRNILRTDVAETRELLTGRMALHMALYAGLPLLVLWRVRIVHKPFARAMLAHWGLTLLSALVFVGALLAVFQPMASLMRNHKEVRYLATPANYLWSLGSVGVAQFKGAAKPRQSLGLDAKMAALPAGAKPQLVVMVVGETARAANWGLNASSGGYARQTTPQLAALNVINFNPVTSCGTNTEVSLPCMFAPVGRRSYDEAAIRGSESLLHVIARAGAAVHWRDNQSGCKGVCDGLPGNSSVDEVLALNPPGLCAEGRCLDEGLLAGLDERMAALQAKGGKQVLVLHMLGNHGPSYFRRYPPEFEQFKPACQNDDLARCSQSEIVNSYDNALLYTDHVIAQLISKLQAKASAVDTAVVYASDHGESLGENGLFLHGIPYAIAPKEQTQVPMVMWFSAGMRQSLALNEACLRQRAAQPSSHNNLFHTALGMLNISASVYEPSLDLLKPCRSY